MTNIEKLANTEWLVPLVSPKNESSVYSTEGCGRKPHRMSIEHDSNRPTLVPVFIASNFC